MDYADIGEGQRKHLELVQGVITRLAGNSFVIKGWAITLFIALMGFALSGHRPLLALLAASVTVVLWVLDSYFLQAERIFRRFYAAILRDPRAEWRPAPFAMDATSPASLVGLGIERDRAFFFEVMLSVTLCGLYGPLVVAAVITANVLAC